MWKHPSWNWLYLTAHCNLTLLSHCMSVLKYAFWDVLEKLICVETVCFVGVFVVFSSVNMCKSLFDFKKNNNKTTQVKF